MSSTVIGPIAITYDTRFGTDAVTAAATGWFTFDLHAGCRRIWLNSVEGNDANNGLTAATAKKTFAAAFNLYIGAGNTPGDQWMIAGTGGRTYTDPGSLGNITFKHGISKAYPAMIMCYDPANPNDTSKYGRLFGADQPVIQLPASGGSALSKSTDGSLGGTPDPSPGIDHYFGAQGITFDGQNNEGAGLAYTGRHDGMVFQNCRFSTCSISFDNAGSSYGLSQDINISKSSVFGCWATTGNNPGTFCAYINGFWVQDSVIIHCSWKLGFGRTRNTTTYPNNSTGDTAWATAGGANQFGQGTYYAADNINGRFDRVFYANNAANGFNIRGGALCSQITTFREPIAFIPGGFSGGPTEAPDGVLIQVDDYVALEGTDIDSSSQGQRGSGLFSTNTIDGSYLRNAVFADNSQYGQSNNFYFSSYRSSNIPPTQRLLLDKIRGYNWSPTILTQQDPATCLVDLSDCILDGVATGTTGSSIAWTAGTFPNAKTTAQVITAMGFASENAMYDAMVEYPHLPWSQAIHAIALPAYGLTPKYTTVSPPSLTGLTTPRTIGW